MNLYKFAELYDRNGDLTKRWYVGYYYIHPESRKFQIFRIWISTKYLTKHARRVKANEIIESINQKLKEGFNPFQNENIGYTLVTEAVLKIVKIKSTYLRERTNRTYNTFVNNLIEWINKKHLTHLSIDSFNFQYTLMYSDYLKGEKKLSNRSHNNNIEGLKTLFNDLVEREYIMKNPFKKVKPLPEEQRNVYAYNEFELKTLKEYCSKNDEKLWLVCQFIFYCAIRPAEIVKLRIRDIDVFRGKINIPAEVSKNKKQSLVSMPRAFQEQLLNLNLHQIDQEYYLFSKKLLPGNFLIAPTRLAERFKKVANKLGLKRRLYDLKHTGAGLAIQSGANIKDLQLHLRHSDIRITDEYLKAFSSEPSQTFIDNYPVI